MAPKRKAASAKAPPPDPAEVERLARLLHDKANEFLTNHYKAPNCRSFDGLADLSQACYRHVARAVIADRERGEAS